MAGYEEFETGRAPVKAWVKGVPVEAAAQRDLVAVEHTLKQVVCVKG